MTSTYSKKRQAVPSDKQKPKTGAAVLGAVELAFNKYGLWIALTLVAALAVAVFYDFLSFQKLYLFRDIGSDTITGYYPQLYHIADYLKTDGIPRWSFNQGLGQNVFPLNFWDPPSDLVILLGKNLLGYGIIYVVILKMLCAGLAFYLLLRKISISGMAAVIGALSFAFCGFMTLAGQWQQFSTEAILLALLLYSFERLYQDNDWLLLPLVVAATIILQPVFMYLHTVLLIFYVILRIIENGIWAPKKITSLLIKLAGLGILGFLISVVAAIPILQSMLSSPRAGAASYGKVLSSIPPFSFSGNWDNVTSIMRFFSNDLLGVGSSFSGSGNYLEAPLYYCGLATLLLVPQLFAVVDKRRKLAYGGLLALVAIPVVFPYFRRAFWLFTGDYYRGFCLVVIVILLISAFKALDGIIRRGRVNLPILLATVVILLAALYFPYPPDMNHPIAIDDSLRTVIASLLVGYAVLLALIRIQKLRIPALMFILVATVGELGYSAYLTTDTRPVVTSELINQRAWYNDFSIDATDYLHRVDKSFFRVFKEYQSGSAMHYSINDAKVQNFFGVTSYHSFNQINYVRFLGELGIIDTANEWQTRWISPVVAYDQRFHTLVSMKYILTKDPNSQWKRFDYDSVAAFGDVLVLKNRNFLPFGFTYDAYLPFSEFHQLTKDQKYIAMQKCFVIRDDSTVAGKLQKLPTANLGAPYTAECYATDIAARKADALAITSFSQNDIRGTIGVSKDKLLFFSIPYDEGWSATVDGKPVRPMLVNVGFTGLLLGKGTHTVELHYTVPHIHACLIVSILGLLLYVAVMVVKSVLDRRQKEGRRKAA